MLEVVYELSFVSFAIFEKNLSEAFHPSSSEFSLVFYPISASAYQLSFALIMIVFPLPFIYNVSICINQLSFSLHFAFYPITKIVTAVIIDVFASSMSQSISFFSLIPVSIRIDLTRFYVRSILGYQCACQSFARSCIVERIEYLAKIIGIELWDSLIT